MQTNELVEQLTSSQFTLAVKLPFQVGDKREEKEVVIDYRFDEEIEEKINAGTFDGVGEGEAKEQVPRPYTVAEQLAMIVKRIHGIDEAPGIAFFRKFDKRHQQMLVKAILADVFPNEQPSRG